MKAKLIVLSVTSIVTLCSSRESLAQNLVDHQRRILDGKGGAIERGSVVVRDGKIVSVAAGSPPNVPGARVIDAQGQNGDARLHRRPSSHHWRRGDPAQWLDQQDAARGCRSSSTPASRRWCPPVMPPDQILELRRSGPRRAPSRDRGSSRQDASGLARAGGAGGRGRARARAAARRLRRLHHQRGGAAAIPRDSTTRGRRFVRPRLRARFRPRTRSRPWKPSPRPASTTSRRRSRSRRAVLRPRR